MKHSYVVAIRLVHLRNSNKDIFDGKRLLYMINRLNLGFYSHLKIHQLTHQLW